MFEDCSVIKIEGYVALFDILGFGNLVRNNDLAKVFETYKKCKDAFEENFHTINALFERDAIIFQLFSDPFLIYIKGVSDDDFLILLVVCDFLFEAAIVNNLPIRGAIIVGDLTVGGDVVFGKPIIDAYEMEQQQKWIGCWISDGCVQKVGNWEGHVERKSVSRMVMSENCRNDFEVQEVVEKVRFSGVRSENPNVRVKYDNMNRFMDSVLTEEYL